MNKNEKELNILVNKLHKQIYDLENSMEYRIGKKLSKNFFIRKAYSFYNWIKVKNLPTFTSKIDNIENQEEFSNLSEKKIVIYTCITGNYDEVVDPMYCSNNIEYILYTNNEKIKSNKWKVKNIENDSNLNNILLNRYIKMHPHELFKNYDYSIYVDGNIKIFSDLSCWVNLLNEEYGIALSMHSTRNKLSDELKACEILKKGNIDKMKEQINQYLKDGMPDDYGLLEAPVIVTDLHSETSKKILDNWWNEFVKSNSYRDQIALPYTLFKMKIPICEIGKISNDIWHDPKIEKQEHKRG